MLVKERRHCNLLLHCTCTASRICAIQAEWPEGAEALIASGAAVDARSAAVDTPLLWAAFKGLLPVCQALIGAGADVNVMGGLGNRPLHLAVSADHHEVSRSLATAVHTVGTPYTALSQLLSAIMPGNI
jgi:ankyrin repeat protein